jgi:two-component system, NarL family, sensor histidine kinase DesK
MAPRFKVFNALRGKFYPDRAELGDIPMYVLAYLGFLFMPWFAGVEVSLPLTFFSIFLFLPLYFLQWYGRHLVFIAFGMWLIWLLLVRFNWGMSTYVIYACSVLGAIPKLRIASVSLVILLASTCLVLMLIQAPTVAFVAPVLMGAMTFCGTRAHHESLHTQAFLRLSLQEISKLAERGERERIARDVHDLLGHSLTLIALKADLAAKLIRTDVDGALAELEQIKSTARDSLSEVRQVVHGMRAAQMSVELAKSKLACEAANVAMHVDLDASIALSRTLEDVLASVLREATNNLIRHAKAENVFIQLRKIDKRFVLEIRDDGRSRSFKEGHGLSAMRERVQEIGGQIEFEANARSANQLLANQGFTSKGFVVRVSLAANTEPAASHVTQEWALT